MNRLGRLDRRWWAALGLLSVLAAYVLVPLVRTAVEGGWPPEKLIALWTPANGEALGNSVGVSLLTVLLSGLVGAPLAWVLGRYDVPGRRALSAIVALPLALPPLVGALAFLFLYGESGILPRAIQALLGLDAPPFGFAGRGAVLAVHVYSFYVYFYLFVTAALANLDESVLEAARDLGAGRRQTLRQVVLPALGPALGGAALIVFMSSMASFTAPLLFAGDARFLTTQIYNAKLNGDLAGAAGLATVLTAASVVFLVGLRRVERSGATVSAGKGLTRRSRLVAASALGRGLLAVGAGGVALLVLLPLATIGLLSFAKEGSWTYQLLPTAYTGANYLNLIRDPAVWAPVGHSLGWSAASTAVALAIGGAVGYLVTRRYPLARLIETVAVLPLAVPGTVVALALLVAFSQPTVLTFGAVGVGSTWLMGVAYAVRGLPLVAQAAVVAFAGVGRPVEEASADLGAGLGRRLRRIVLPLALPGLVAGALLAFVAGLGEFVASILLYVYDNRPISVEILSQIRRYDFGAASTYAVVLMALILIATVASRLATRRSG